MIKNYNNIKLNITSLINYISVKKNYSNVLIIHEHQLSFSFAEVKVRPCCQHCDLTTVPNKKQVMVVVTYRNGSLCPARPLCPTLHRFHKKTSPKMNKMI